MDNIFKSSGLPKRCQVLPPRTVSMERAKVTGVIHCTTCVSIPNDKQVMQSASSVHLATAHVGVSLAKSSIATSNGKVSDGPRVRARVGRFLRSIPTLFRNPKTWLKTAH